MAQYHFEIKCKEQKYDTSLTAAVRTGIIRAIAMGKTARPLDGALSVTFNAANAGYELDWR